MKRVWGITALVAAAALMFAGSAAAMEFHIVHSGNVAPRNRHRMERAIEIQVNRQFRRHWPVGPISFGSKGVPIYFVSPRGWNKYGCGTGADGCHSVLRDGEPVIWIENNPWFSIESMPLSHEVMEVLADPELSTVKGGYLVEPCDPVEHDSYAITVGRHTFADAVLVSDFVYPRWFEKDSAGPWDFDRDTTRALRPVRGASDIWKGYGST